MSGQVIITIDGPAGTGKSSVAHALAERLGLEFLDTGAMYRAAALVSIERSIDPEDGAALARAIDAMDLHFDWTGNPPRLMLGDREISDRIRNLDVSERVSIVAGQPEVRAFMVAEQRRIAKRHPQLVTEGRDQGSVVFPEADVRFYLDAAPEVRAERRVQQLGQMGVSVDLESILKDIVRRDEMDSTRDVGPLIRPQGAVTVDTSDLDLNDVVDRLETDARRRMPDQIAGAGS